MRMQLVVARYKSDPDEPLIGTSERDRKINSIFESHDGDPYDWGTYLGGGWLHGQREVLANVPIKNVAAVKTALIAAGFEVGDQEGFDPGQIH